MAKDHQIKTPMADMFIAAAIRSIMDHTYRVAGNKKLVCVSCGRVIQGTIFDKIQLALERRRLPL